MERRGVSVSLENEALPLHTKEKAYAFLVCNFMKYTVYLWNTTPKKRAEKLINTFKKKVSYTHSWKEIYLFRKKVLANE